MTDELDDLKRALHRAAPGPDPERKLANLALAKKNFETHQGSRDPARLTSKGGLWRRLVTGVRHMYISGPLRGGMVTTTALVAAVGVGIYWPAADSERRLGFADFVPAASDAPADLERRQQSLDAGSVKTAPEVAANQTDEISAQAPLAIVAAPEQSRVRNRAELSTQAQKPPQAKFADSASGFGLAETRPDVRPANSESFANERPSSLQITAQDPVSTFSIDVDTASYAVMRSSLLAGQRPPSAAIRVEEMVNYFTYAYPAPDGAHPFEPTVTVMPTPWNSGTQLVHIGIQGTPPALEERKPVNLVFLVDTSGSMGAPDKLPLLQQSLRLMLSELDERDEIAIVAYAGRAGQVLAPTPASEAGTISAALTRLTSGGSTAGASGIQAAYDIAEAMSEDGEVTRVILATDGDFNVGVSNPEALKDLIAAKRDTGVYLSVLGFGRGNLQDSTMQALAQNGNGTAAYIDSLREAQKVLVTQLAASLEPIANDVKIQVEFNPGQIAEYRLIGYETRALRREDFNNDKVDAGDIGAGHQVTAIYEVTPVGSSAVHNDQLRYQPAQNETRSDELGFLKLRYKRPGETVSTLTEAAIEPRQGEPSSETRFAVAMAGFGELLRGGNYQRDWTIADARALAAANRGADQSGLRAEAISLMRLAETLAP